MSKPTQIILIFALINIALFSWFSSFIAEDAYIVYRYSENLAHGNGLVFNQGEYVSALTSPLHSLIVSALYRVTGESAWTNRIFALVLHFAATLYALNTIRLERGLILFGLTVWISPYATLWTAGGLETMYLSSFLIVAFAAGRRCMDEESTKYQTLFSVCLGLAFLTRFDSCLVTLPMWLHVATRQWKVTNHGKLQSILKLLLPGLFIAIVWLSTSYWYYHDIFPTSVYHKPARWDDQTTNLRYMIQFGLLTGLIPLIGWSVSNHVKHPGSSIVGAATNTFTRHWGVLLGGLIFFGYATGTATAHMMFSYRMLLPYLPILTLIIINLIDSIHSDGLTAGRFGKAGWTLVSILAILFQSTQFYYIDQHSVNPGRYGEYTNLSRQTYIRFMELLADQAGAINEHWASQDIVRPPQVHVYAAGIVPYRLDQSRVVDWGLISYRKNVSEAQRGLLYSSDYILTLTPRHSTKKDQLQRDPGTLELVHERELAGFDHADDRLETFSVYYNPSPIEYVLPDYVDGPELTPIPKEIQ